MPIVLLTRPDGENEGLARLLSGHGLEVMIRPLIELAPVEITPAKKKLAMNIDRQDAVIFVSKSSVRYSSSLLESYWPQWPVSTRCLSVGPGTAAELAKYGIRSEHPAAAGSEGLLKLPVLQTVSGSRVLIIRGSGGRELLATELARRGAQVAYLEVYRRSPVTGLDWLELPPGSFVVVTSLEALLNLKANLGKQISRYRVVVVSHRIADEVKELTKTTIAAGASDQALYDAILKSL